MKRLIVLSVLLFSSLLALAQRENTFYVKQFYGPGAKTVGGMTAAAQAACNADTAIPCIIVFDPTLAKYAVGDMPAKCSQCVWMDYRSTAISTYLKKLNGGIVFADQYPGANAGARITAAIADLPSQGGTVDARGFGATTQTIAATVAVGGQTKPITLICDPATIFVPSGTNVDMFALAPNSVIRGVTVDVTGVAGYAGKVFKLSGFKWDVAPSTHREMVNGIWNVSINAVGNTTATALYLDSHDDFRDDISFVTFSDWKIYGGQYGIHAVASNTGWINANNFINFKLDGSVYGFKAEATTANASVMGNSFVNFVYEYLSDVSNAGVNAIWLSGTQNCGSNMFNGTQIWDMAGHTSIKFDAACRNNFISGLLDGDHEDPSGTNVLYDLWGGAPAYPNLKFAVPGSGSVSLSAGDATHTGFLEWRKPDDTRLGFIGYDAGGNVTLNLQNGANLVVNGGVGVFQNRVDVSSAAIGGGADLSRFDRVTTGSIDLASVASGACTAEQTATVSGAAAGDMCFVVPSTARNAGTFYTCSGSGTNQVKWQLCNWSGVAVDRSSDTYVIRLIR